KDMLIVALTNLLYAAVKFARNRSEVRIAATDESAVTATIRFSCRNIPPEELERLFSAVSEPQDPRLGTGLALYMGRRILRHHGCDVTVEADSDGISLFRFTLPA
ncbi:MAG: ATP-binding protein, partial [Candidatus Xenobia bacterium]